MLFDEGAERLFAGPAQTQASEPGTRVDFAAETIKSMHRAALQRVDRSASAQGLVAQLPFLDLDLFEYAILIPAELKLRRNGTTVDKWILRQAMSGALPENLLRPPDVALWRGAGLGFLLALSAEEQVTDTQYYCERVLPNGWKLHSKEAVMYYRIFREHFGEMADLSWMGRMEEVAQV
jgi:asparagine synthase (glutamine-hydrolysing)